MSQPTPVAWPDTASALPVEGGSVVVRATGSAVETLVCLHGWTLDHSVWDPQHDALSDIATVISMDRRGFGRSSAPASLPRELDDLRAILARHGDQPVWLLGQSQSARIALAFAARHPDRVHGLILQAPPAMDDDAVVAPEIPYARFKHLADRDEMEQVRQEWLAHPLMHSPTPAIAAKLAAMVQRYRGTDLRGNADCLRPDALVLAAIACPTLIVVGAYDTGARILAAQALAARIDGATVQIVPDAGHLCNLEAPDHFNTILRRFLTQDETQRSIIQAD